MQQEMPEIHDELEHMHLTSRLQLAGKEEAHGFYRLMVSEGVQKCVWIPTAQFGRFWN